jgi:acetylornithine deacetylase
MDTDEIIRQAIATTRDLIQIPSESSSHTETSAASPEAGIIEYLTRVCQAENLKCMAQEALPGRYNFICRFPKTEAPKLLLLAHMDTVSAQGMKKPFAATLKDGAIHGRGACDDKGPFSTAFAVLTGLRRQKVPLNYDVTFVGTVDEECSMSGAAMFAKSSGDYDLCVALEPTGLQLINAHKGVYRFQVITKGKAAHSSAPERGDNAIVKMHSIMGDLLAYGEKIAQQSDPDLGNASLAMTQINGGTVINIIPDKCTLSVDIRLLPLQGPKQTGSELKKLVGDRGAIRKIFATKAIHSSLEEQEIQLFQKSIQTAGFSAQAATAAYATDCSKLTRKGPCVVWGPGHIEQAHKPEEYIEISQIEGACRILTHYLTGSLP